MDIDINPLAVGLSAASMFVIGGAWYSAVFAKAWQRHAGVTDEQLRSNTARVFVGAALLSLLAATSLAAFVGSESAGAGAVIGAITGVTFAAVSYAIVAIFERRPSALVLINAGYLVVAFTVMGLIDGAIQ